MIKKYFIIIWPLIFLVFLSVKGRTSVQGKIEGTVIDSNGHPLENVKVTIISLKVSTRKYELTTQKDGKFIQIGLWPGYYMVYFKKEGFAPMSKEARVSIAASTKLEIKLEKASQVMARNISESDNLFLEGNKFFAQNNYEKAIELYNKAIQLNPSQWGYYFNLALAYKKANQAEKALENFKKVLELNPSSFSANKEMGEILALSENWPEAQKYYERAIEISPDDPDGFYNLGVCLTNQGQSEAALRAFLKTIELKNDYAEAYYQLGTLYISQNKVDKAIFSLEKFLELAPQHQKANLARQLLEYLKKKKNSMHFP